jgi:RimJ/RimL family protein N-acetyltransferase
MPDGINITPKTPDHSIQVVGGGDLEDLLPLMRAYCDFYETSPSDDALLALSRSLLEDPQREGLQLIARDSAGTAVGFTTIFWTWSTTRAARIAVMNDLFVSPASRGTGLAERLIAACMEQCADHGAQRLEWQTAPDNLRAQTVYDRIGASREQWIDFGIEVEATRTEAPRSR